MSKNLLALAIFGLTAPSSGKRVLKGAPAQLPAALSISKQKAEPSPGGLKQNGIKTIPSERCFAVCFEELEDHCVIECWSESQHTVVW